MAKRKDPVPLGTVNVPGPTFEFALADPATSTPLRELLDSGVPSNAPKGYGVRLAVTEEQLSELRELAQLAIDKKSAGEDLSESHELDEVSVRNLKNGAKRFLARTEPGMVEFRAPGVKKEETESEPESKDEEQAADSNSEKQPA